MTHVFGDVRDELGHFTFQILNCLRIVSVHIVFCISPQQELKCLTYSRCVLTIDLVVRYSSTIFVLCSVVYTIVNKKNFLGESNFPCRVNQP